MWSAGDRLRFLSIDFETATARRDSACAVGVARVDDGKIVASASYFIQPPGNRYDSFNIGIHGITPEMTAGAPPFVPVMNSILEWAEGLPLVAHNASFDMSVLRAGYDSNGYGYPRLDYYCTLLMSRAALPDLPDYRLPRVLTACGGAVTSHHDPKFDAEACAEIALAIAGKQGVATLDELCSCVGMRVGHLYAYAYKPCRCVGGVATRSSTRQPMSDYVCNVEADASGPFYDADVAFTGAMASMPRGTAMQMVAERGGRPRTTVSKLTEYVVVGQLDHDAFMQGNPSRKLKTALDLVESGHSIQILSEKEFLALLEVK